jgi:hypothetical protein
VQDHGLEESNVKNRWWSITVLSTALLMIMLVGCGGDDDGDSPSGGDATSTAGPIAAVGGPEADATGSVQSPPSPTPIPPTHTPVPPPPRERLLPEGEPYAFEPPFSVGDFVRQTLRGNATATRAGGQQATYRRDTETIVVQVYRFDLTSEAMATVESALNASTIVAQVEEPYSSPAVTFGLVQDQHGAYLAAWNHYQWVFLVSTPESLDVMNGFLNDFPY